MSFQLSLALLASEVHCGPTAPELAGEGRPHQPWLQVLDVLVEGLPLRLPPQVVPLDDVPGSPMARP
eukprot:10722246-Alexandrium_andersonii.AAC.1